MLDVNKERNQANRRLGRSGKFVAEINGPIFSAMAEHELTALVHSGEDDNQGPKHVLTPWGVLASLEEITLDCETVIQGSEQ